MPQVFKLRKGLNIPLKGEAVQLLEQNNLPETFALKPSDFHGLIPKLVVKVGDLVKAGTPLFYDKYQPEIQFVSPVSGEVIEINRGERRRILNVVVKADKEIVYESFPKSDISILSLAEIKLTLLKSGIWPSIIRRPYGIIAKADENPKSVYISCFDSSPLAPDYDFIFDEEEKSWQTGIDALLKLTGKPLNLGLSSKMQNKLFASTKGVNLNYFDGPHPAGNVGIQIHKTAPINKGEVIWILNPQDVLMIGRLFNEGRYDASRIIALVGSEVRKPKYFHFIKGGNIELLVENEVTNRHVRVISGNVLTGKILIKSDYIGYYDSMITVIPEGDYYEMLGWASLRLKNYSPSRTFFSWLFNGKKKFVLDTNTHGEERAFVLSDQYENVVPMDIYPVYLLKAIIANDIERMEKLGIYEVIEEDLALCEYICTSKIKVQSIVRQGINLMIKEV